MHAAFGVEQGFAHDGLPGGDPQGADPDEFPGQFGHPPRVEPPAPAKMKEGSEFLGRGVAAGLIPKSVTVEFVEDAPPRPAASK